MIIQQENTMYNIIIPDIHQEIDKLSHILNMDVVKEANEVTFLGDYFDSFTHDRDTFRTCEFLNSISETERYRFLIGNHDVHYLSPIDKYRCSGYTEQKHRTVQFNLSKDFVDRLAPFHYFEANGNGVLVSHAGFHPSILKNNYDKKKPGDMFGGENGEELKKSISMYTENEYFSAGWDRNGSYPVGGITWLDWNSFVPVDGLSQIVGHSFRSRPLFKKHNYCKNINIDTGLMHILKVDLGTNVWETIYTPEGGSDYIYNQPSTVVRVVR